jgi:Lrp/AsnC family leucine-responsive transcriptional regulator
MKQKFAIDRKDWQILEALQANARTTNTEIAKRIGLSQPAVTARIQRLEDVGIVEGYGARIRSASAPRLLLSSGCGRSIPDWRTA